MKVLWSRCRGGRDQVPATRRDLDDCGSVFHGIILSLNLTSWGDIKNNILVFKKT